MRLKPLFATLGSLTLVACGSGNLSDLEEYVLEVKRQEPSGIEPLPEIKQPNTFVFNPASRRDPFVLDLQSVEVATKRSGSGIAPDPTRRKEELEQFSLDSLDMVGTMEQGDTVWALITTPENALHHVRVGNYLGLNNGQIVRITEEEIELTEIVSDGDGAWQERRAAIALSE